LTLTYSSERLQQNQNLSDFDCGEPILNRWLHDSAATSDQMDTARTFVWADDSKLVFAYFSFCPHEIHRETVSIKLGRGSPRVIPAILLARFALDCKLHSQGLGKQLLIDALSRAVNAINAVGGRLIVVDALHEQAAGFYAHHGFIALPDNPLRLVMKSSDAQASLQLR